MCGPKSGIKPHNLLHALQTTDLTVPDQLQAIPSNNADFHWPFPNSFSQSMSKTDNSQEYKVLVRKIAVFFADDSRKRDEMIVVSCVCSGLHCGKR